MFFSKILFLTIFFTSSVYGSLPSREICGEVDDRVSSYNSRIGRIIQKLEGSGGVCTGTLIGKSCMISAGHCRIALKYVEFNVPLSDNGKLKRSEPIHLYKVTAPSIRYARRGPGRDWAVFKVEKNQITGSFPGEIYGFYNVSFDQPRVGDTLRISGHGVSIDPTLTFTQQTAIGPLVSTDGAALTYQVDTMGGNSGATIISEVSGEVVGIHTHGGCGYGGDSGNYGTSLSKSDDLRAAIEACLKE